MLLVTLVASSGIALVIYKDSIINLLKNEIDQRISSKLEVKSIDLKLLKGFPNISIQFSDVKFHSAFADELLLESDHIYFVLNIIDLFNNNITIERLEIENATVIIHKNKRAQNNFNVFVNTDTVSRESGKLDIKSTRFLNVKIINIDDAHEIYDEVKISSLYGAASFSETIYHFNVTSSAIIEKSNYGYLAWLLGKKIYLETKVTYNGKEIDIKTSKLKLGTSQFSVKGYWGLANNKNISINLTSANLQFSELTTLFPSNFQDALEPFRGKGIIGLDAHLEGGYGGGNWPSLEVDFSLRGFEINSKELTAPLEDIQLVGSIHMPNIRNLEIAKLNISNFTANAKNNIFEINAALVNFINPQISGKIKGNFDVPWAISLLKANTLLGKSSGLLSIDVDAVLNLKTINGQFEIDKSIINGLVKFNELEIDSLFSLPLKNINGEILFSNHKINLKTLGGFYGESDFLINGAISSKIEEDILEANLVLESSFLNLDEIVEVVIKSTSDSISKVSQHPLKFHIDLELQVDKLIFERFNGDNFKAELSIDQNGLRVNKATSNGMGGSVILAGAITSQFNGDYYIEAKVRTREVDLDSIFYVFNNFNQSFITDSVMKGELFSDVYTSMYFNKDWQFKRELLYAEGLLKVKNGELNNFEPLMALSSYLKHEDENLAKLRFSNLESSIIISNDTVFISDMHIGSNVRDIKIGGYHTLDQHIAYRLSVPVINNKKDKDNEFGEVKIDSNGKLYMPFKITGTTSDYKVTYDLMKASSNFAKGIKMELTELGNSLIKRERSEDKVDTLLLEEEEFFDWDNE